MRKRISAVGNSGALLLSRDMLGLLGVGVGDEIEISFSGQSMIVRPVSRTSDEVDRQQIMAAAFDKAWARHKGALKRLATIDDETEKSKVSGRRSSRRRAKK